MSANAVLDALFAGATSARVWAEGADARGPIGTSVLADFAGGELAQVRDALRVLDGPEFFHCMCLGDLAIELRRSHESVATVAFHHARSVRIPGVRTDVALADGPALLRLLAAHGVPSPLAAYEASREAARQRALGREAWIDAVPEGLRSQREPLETDPSGLPHALTAGDVDGALGALRASLGTDVDVARALLDWLATGTGRLTGYPAYEALPVSLLARLPLATSVAALAADTDDARALALVRVVADYQRVTFDKRSLAEVPATFFDRARDVLGRVGDDDARARLAHAAKLSDEMRARASSPRVERARDGWLVVGESDDGPFNGLVARGGALYAVDVQRVVRFDPGSTEARPALTLESAYALTTRDGHRLVVADARGWRMHAIDASDRATELTRGDGALVELAAATGHVAFLVRGPKGAVELAVRAPDGIERRVSDPSTWGLGALDSASPTLFGFTGGFADASVFSLDLVTLARRTLAHLGPIGASMASPRAVCEGGALLVGAMSRVLAIEGGRARDLAVFDAPVAAVAADAMHVAVLLATSDDRWSLAAFPRAGGDSRVLGTFTRRPFHRHPLVIARGRAVTVANDVLIASPPL